MMVIFLHAFGPWHVILVELLFGANMYLYAHGFASLHKRFNALLLEVGISGTNVESAHASIPVGLDYRFCSFLPFDLMAI